MIGKKIFKILWEIQFYIPQHVHFEYKMISSLSDQSVEAVGGGRGGSGTTSTGRHAQPPGSGRFSASGPPPKTGPVTNAEKPEDPAKTAMNKR